MAIWHPVLYGTGKHKETEILLIKIGTTVAVTALMAPVTAVPDEGGNVQREGLVTEVLIKLFSKSF